MYDYYRSCMILLGGPGLVGPDGSSYKQLQSLLVLSIVCYCSYALLGICPLSNYLYFLVHVTMGDSSLTACWRRVATYSLLLGREFSLGPDYYLMDTAVS